MKISRQRKSKRCFTLSHLRAAYAVVAVTMFTYSVRFSFETPIGFEDILVPTDTLNPSGAISGTSREHPEYHVLFSTGCSPQQHWESYVFFYHAFKVGQPGNVTRLVSGCNKKEEIMLQKFHDEKIRYMSERFHVHFTPEYGNQAVFHSPYKYNNKPNSVHHWMVNVLHMDQANRPKTVEDGIVLLLDPDMILLRPLLHNFTGQQVIYANNKEKEQVVRHGRPFAQQDGYLSNEWQSFKVSYITQGGSFPKFKRRDGERYYNSGPPYLATVRDMWNMVLLWKEYIPRVYEEFPKLFAEMYGLVIATTQLKLPHTLIKSIVVSTTTTTTREGWEYVDSLSNEEVCNVTSWASTPRMPIALHYCSRYFLGKFFFSKYRLKRRFISCDVPLLEPPPGDLATRYNYWVRPPPDKGFQHEITVENITSIQAKREAFMLCGLISAVNEAARYYKAHHCDASANTSEVYNFHNDPYSG